MMRITLDSGLADKLMSLTSPIELCEPSGRVIGHFTPLINMSGWEPVSPDISEEELNRRLRSTEKRYTTAEVLAHLEKL